MIIKKIKILLIIIFILNIHSSDGLAKQEAKILFRINNEIITIKLVENNAKIDRESSKDPENRPQAFPVATDRFIQRRGPRGFQNRAREALTTSWCREIAG